MAGGDARHRRRPETIHPLIMIKSIATLGAVLVAALALPYLVFLPIHAVIRLIWETVFQR